MRTSPLVHALRAFLEGRPLMRLSQSTVDDALHNRLGGTLYHIRAPLSDFDSARCEARWAANLATHLRRIQHLEDLWSDDLPPPLVYKGTEISERLFDDPGARRAGDLDAIVPSWAFPAACQAMQTTADEVVTARHERLSDEPSAGVGYRFGQILIELHRDPQPRHRRRLSGDAVYARAVPGQLGSLAVRYPTDIDRVLLWASGQAKSGFCSDLADFLDLCLALAQIQDPAALWQAADAAELSAVLDLCLLRLQKIGLPCVISPRGAPDARAFCRLLPSPTSPRWPVPAAPLSLSARYWSWSNSARRAVIRRALAGKR